MSTPYMLLDGWSYYIEAVREQAWPACAYRFVSFPALCNKIDLWNAPGDNQEFQFIQVNETENIFYVQADKNRNTYISYSEDCNATDLSMSLDAGKNQQYRFIPSKSNQFEYIIEAVGRSKCLNI